MDGITVKQLCCTRKRVKYIHVAGAAFFITHTYIGKQMFKTLIERYKQYKNYRETYNALQDLNDRELKDIGVTRNMIRRVASERADTNENLEGWV